jgi:hypothetical protein
MEHAASPERTLYWRQVVVQRKEEVVRPRSKPVAHAMKRAAGPSDRANAGEIEREPILERGEIHRSGSDELHVTETPQRLRRRQQIALSAAEAGAKVHVDTDLHTERCAPL